MTRVLVTRPAEQARALIPRIEAKGLTPVVEPLIAIRPIPGVTVDAAGIQAIVFTSANGVRALTAARGEAEVSRALPAFAVGAATAAAARAAGFANVTVGEGAIEDLARLIAVQAPAERGPILHVSGSAVARDLAGLLDATGHSVRRAVLYKSVPADALGEYTQRLLAERGIAAALFFSPRTARTFVTLIEASGLRAATASMVSFGLSPAVTDALTSLPFARFVTAARPTTDALIDSLGGVGLTN
ncbi:MAG TPA: uroporphyrinogen-III synthase [Alphaproteobacteria bacterium]|jgi:uroporphyrinogen-III synthase|nr:uroporphyrinogen-III synthase [Alphaproteobacteria bacterium]